MLIKLHMSGPQQSQLGHFESLHGGGQGEQRDATASGAQPRAFGTSKVVTHGS